MTLLDELIGSYGPIRHDRKVYNMKEVSNRHVCVLDYCLLLFMFYIIGVLIMSRNTIDHKYRVFRNRTELLTLG